MGRLSAGTGRCPRMAALAVLVALTGCGDGAPPSAVGEPVHGRLVVIGGGLSADNEAVYREILQGREGDGPVCVLPTAGASPESSMESAVARIERWGGEGAARGVFISTENPESAQDPEVADELRGCGGFFFTGGVQSRIVDVFRPEGRETPAHEALLERFRAGAVVAGSSAGAAALSHPMIAGGSSEAALQEGVGVDGVRLAEGLGLLPDLLVDQHFLARGRVGRLMVALVEAPELALGAGVDENTALVVHGNRAWVAGASGVVLVDAGRALRSQEAPGAATGIRLELLGAGDTLDLTTLIVRPGAAKRPLAELPGAARDQQLVPGVPDVPEAPSEAPAEGLVQDLAEDLAEPWILLHLFHRLAAAPERTVTGEVAGRRVTLRTGPDRRGVALPEVGIRGTPLGLSVGPVEVEITGTDPGG